MKLRTKTGHYEPSESAKRHNDWRTPLWLFQELDRRFKFDLDVCATKETALCDRWLDDAVVETWNCSAAFCNPPYGREFITRIIERAKAQTRQGNCGTAVLLLPSRTEMPWWSDLLTVDELIFVEGRVAFLPPLGKPHPPKGHRPVWASVVAVINHRTGYGSVLSSIRAPKNKRELPAQATIPL